jgi:hypothetical protein
MGLTSCGLAAVLRALAAPTTLDHLRRLAALHGLTDADALSALLDALVSAGVLRPDSGDARLPGRALAIRVHGEGPLSELLTEGLRCSGARVSRTTHGNAGGTVGVDLVVLTDRLAADPRLVRDLQGGGLPHLPVLVRDGTGVVGPLVIPGLTSCLSCADLHRADRDPAWPALAAQLREVVGTADRPTLLATAAFALGQLQHIITAVRIRGQPGISPAPAPATLNATVEVNAVTAAIRARRWVRHPLCGCWPAPSSCAGAATPGASGGQTGSRRETSRRQGDLESPLAPA